MSAANAGPLPNDPAAQWSRLGVALVISILLHLLLLALLRPFPPPGGAIGELSLRLIASSDSRDSVAESAVRPKAPPSSPEVEDRGPKPVPDRVDRSPGAVEREPQAGPVPMPPEARVWGRSPLVSAQMTLEPPDGPPLEEGYYSQEDLDRPPEALAPIDARFPKAATDAGHAGSVVAELRLSEDGKVDSARLWKAEHPELVEPALEALKAMRFRPAERAGQPVAARIYYVVLFLLE